MTELTAAQAQKICWDFNNANPPGTPVLAWPGTRDEEPLRTRTRHSAWPIAGTEPCVSVLGYAGGIALTHIDVDPTRQPAPPEISFEPPPCPLCGKDLDHDGDGFCCVSCRVSWGGSGRNGRWHDPDAERCRAVRRWEDADLPDEQCVLALGHRVINHIPSDGFGTWLDTDGGTAVVDCDGNRLDTAEVDQ